MLDLVQLVVGLPSGLDQAPHQALDLALATGFTLWSLALGVHVLRRRRYTDARWGAVDLLAGLTVLACDPWIATLPHRFSSWDAWPFPVTLSTAVGVGIVFTRGWQVAASVASLTAVYLTVTYGQAATADQRGNALANVPAYVAFVFISWLLATYVRRLGREADRSREAAADASAQAERDRQRLLLHDQATLLHLLSEATPDPALEPVLRAQAALAATRVRQFLADEPASRTAAPDAREITLADTLRAVAAEFGDLPLVTNLDLADEPLPGDLLDTLASAVATLLQNVRVHAHAAHVVVHGQTHDGAWEITVRDDGTGFDPDTTPKASASPARSATPCTPTASSSRSQVPPGRAPPSR